MATIKFPKGSRFAEITIRGATHKMVQFGDEDGQRPPQFGKSKATAIVALADAGVEPGVIRDVAVGFGIYKLKNVEPTLIVSGAKALVKAAA